MGKIALVTGASRGIGRAIALRLARDGADVVVHYARNRALAEETARDVEELGARALVVQGDFGLHEQVERCAESVARALDGQPLDVLVHNAAEVVYGDFERSVPDDLDRLMRVNLQAPYFLTQRLLPLLPMGGRIVALSSIAARMAFTEVIEYSLTKAALESLVRALALLLGPRNITVNAVAPGEVLTEMSSWLDDPAAQAMVLERQALPRLGNVEEVADVVAFLAGPDSRWMTGQVVTVSGGYRL